MATTRPTRQPRPQRKAGPKADSRSISPPKAAARKPPRPAKKRSLPLDPVARARQKKRRDKEISKLLWELLGPVLDDMWARWPTSFPRGLSASRPYAADVYETLCKEMPHHSKTNLRAVVDAYCSSEQYLEALAAGGPRYDLNGRPKGRVTAEEMAKAADELRRRRAKEERARLKAEIKSRKVSIKSER